MRIETRNLLADLLLDALDDHGVATALRCLAAYCRSNPGRPVAIAVEEFTAPAAPATQQYVVALLRQHALFIWEQDDPGATIALHSQFTTEYSEIATKVQAYAAALAAWRLPEESLRSLGMRERAVQKGVLLFNHHLFFEVHEILEEQWKQEDGDVRLFLQGLIQVAVAFHHQGSNNFRGATALLRDGLAKLSPYQPEFLALELSRFISRLEACQQELLRLGADQCQRFPREMIPAITFVRSFSSITS